MTIEKLEAQKAELQKQQQQTIANVNAIGGAIQNCDYWIAELKKAEAKPE